MRKYHVVVPCSGQNVRLLGATLGMIPKVLLPFDKHMTIAEAIVDSYGEAAKTVTFIVRSHTHMKLMQMALAMHKHVRFVIHPESDGSGSAIQTAVEYYKDLSEGFIANWSDVVATCNTIEKLCESIDAEEVSYAVENNDNLTGRYTFGAEDKIYECPAGGIFGLYYLSASDVLPFIMYNFMHGEDFIEFLMQGSPKPVFGESYDIGTFDLYAKHYDEFAMQRGRWFNSIEIDEDVGLIEKAIVDPFGYERINAEMHYYIDLTEKHPDATKLYPKVLSYKSIGFTMEYLKHYKLATDFLDDEETIPAIAEAFRKLHMFKPKLEQGQQWPIDVVDLENEIIGKTINRIKSTEALYDALGYVANDIIAKLQAFDGFVTEYAATNAITVTHDDPHADNIMIKSTYRTKLGDERVKFIDPKGSVGGRQSIYGYPLYDYAKFIYGATFINRIEFVDLQTIAEFAEAYDIDNHVDKVRELAYEMGIQEDQMQALLLMLAAILLSAPPFHKPFTTRMLLLAKAGVQMLNYVCNMDKD